MTSMEGYKEADLIHVTLSNFRGYSWVYRIDKIDPTAHNEFERVTLSTIEEHAENEKTKYYVEGERTTTVEPNWFTANPNRKIKILGQ